MATSPAPRQSDTSHASTRSASRPPASLPRTAAITASLSLTSTDASARNAQQWRRHQRVEGEPRHYAAAHILIQYLIYAHGLRDIAAWSGRSFGFVQRVFTETGTAPRSRNGARAPIHRARHAPHLLRSWIPESRQPAWDGAGTFHTVHGHVMAPAGAIIGGNNLGHQLTEVRAAHRNHDLTPVEVAAWESRGMTWDDATVPWWEGIAGWLTFHRHHGHHNVPHGYQMYGALDLLAWREQQLHLHQHGQLTAVQTATLNLACGLALPLSYGPPATTPKTSANDPGRA